MSNNIIIAVIEVLKDRKKPISVNELSFKMRMNESAVLQSLKGLLAAKIVLQQDDCYVLNRREHEYRPEYLLNN